MNAGQKKRPATLASRQSKSAPGETENRNISSSAKYKNEASIHANIGKPVHISQEEAQSIPADKDPDDPVSR